MVTRLRNHPRKIENATFLVLTFPPALSCELRRIVPQMQVITAMELDDPRDTREFRDSKTSGHADNMGTRWTARQRQVTPSESK